MQPEQQGPIYSSPQNGKILTCCETRGAVVSIPAALQCRQELVAGKYSAEYDCGIVLPRCWRKTDSLTQGAEEGSTLHVRFHWATLVLFSTNGTFRFSVFRC